MTEPLLVLERARIDAGGAVLLDALSATTRGDQVGLIGGWEPLFDLFAGRARLAAGSARVRGRDPRGAVRDGKLGLALADAVLPDAWTALDYLRESAELAGIRPRETRHAARGALGAVGLPHLEARRLGTLTPAEKRALLVAHATLGEPEAIALETPFSGLDTRGAELVADAIARAASGRGLLASVSSPAPLGAERALLDRAGEVLVLEAGVLVAQGSPDQALRPDARLAVTVTRRGSELLARLGEIGWVATLAPGHEAASFARLVVEVAAGGSTDDLLDAALAVGAPIVELLPLGAAPEGGARK